MAATEVLGCVGVWVSSVWRGGGELIREVGFVGYGGDGKEDGGVGRTGEGGCLRLIQVPVLWVVVLAEVLKSYHLCSSSPLELSSHRFVMLEPRTVHSQPPFGLESGKV